jgi:beta-phosphoglucomutase-like phosphatase (HAD superfamily)
MALDMRALLESRHGPLPARDERYRVGELITYCRRRMPALEEAIWAVALDHEQRALADATLEPNAREAVTGSRALGWATAVWTNNARAISLAALERCGLLPLFDLVVTRDDMAALKPDPDGWRVIVKALDPTSAVVVGDSWVDGLAAAAAGVPFLAYRSDHAELARRGVSPLASLTDLGALPQYLSSEGASRSEGASTAPSETSPRTGRAGEARARSGAPQAES